MLIGGSAILGLASSVQVSFPFVLGELVPMKDRYLITGLTYTWSVPTAGLGAVVSYAFIQHTEAGWRWCYYLMLITNSVATILWFFFYHPPDFHMLRPQSRMELIKNLDYVGLILFAGGLLAFLFGLSWGGTTYPWKSGQVIGALVAGAVALIVFVVYECYAPVKEPLIPVHLFRNTGELHISRLNLQPANKWFSSMGRQHACSLLGGFCFLWICHHIPNDGL